MGGKLLATKHARSPGVLPGWHDGMADAVVDPSEPPGTLLFLSMAIVGVGAAVPLSCVRVVTSASGNMWKDSSFAGWTLLVAGAALGVAKSLPRVSSAVAWSDPYSPAPFGVVAGPAPFVAGTAPKGVFVPPAT